MADSDAVDGFRRGLPGDVTVGFDIADIEIVGETRAEAEVPDDLSCDLGIIWIQQRKRLSSDIVLEHTVGREGHLRRVLLGRFLVWRRPINATGRYDIELHSLLHKEHVSGAKKGAYFRGVVAGDRISGLYVGVKWAGREQQ